MRVKFIFTLILSFIFTSWAHAETIYFKNGRVLKGKVESKDTLYTTVQEGQYPKKYYNFDIDHIEADKDPNAVYTQDLEKITDKAELIKMLLDVNGTRATMENNFQAILAQAPEDKREKLKGMLQVDKIVDLVIPVYEKHFTEEDLRKLVEFYRSPTGTKFLAVTPTILQETVDVTIKYFKEKDAELK